MTYINNIVSGMEAQVTQVEESHDRGPETNALLHHLMTGEETEIRGSGKDATAWAFQTDLEKGGAKWVPVEDYCDGHHIVAIWLEEADADAWTCMTVREKGQRKDRYVCIFYSDGEMHLTQPNTDEHMTLVDALLFIGSKSVMT